MEFERNEPGEQSPERPPAKQPYAPPRLTVHGTLAALTQFVGPGTADVPLGPPSIPSDRRLKDHLAPVDSAAILSRVAALPISSWTYRDQDPAVRHIGPMAQDFAAAFGLGADDRHIQPVDAHGVALASIQALYRLVETQAAQLSRLQAQVEELQRQLTVRPVSDRLD